MPKKQTLKCGKNERRCVDIIQICDDVNNQFQIEDVELNSLDSIPDSFLVGNSVKNPVAVQALIDVSTISTIASPSGVIEVLDGNGDLVAFFNYNSSNITTTGLQLVNLSIVSGENFSSGFATIALIPNGNDANFDIKSIKIVW